MTIANPLHISEHGSKVSSNVKKENPAATSSVEEDVEAELKAEEYFKQASSLPHYPRYTPIIEFSDKFKHFESRSSAVVERIDNKIGGSSGVAGSTLLKLSKEVSAITRIILLVTISNPYSFSLSSLSISDRHLKMAFILRFS